MPFGQVPVLMIDHKPLPQSGAIIRYLARQFQLEGTTAEEAAFADMIMTSINEVIDKLPFLEKDEKKKVKKRYKFYNVWCTVAYLQQKERTC